MRELGSAALTCLLELKDKSKVGPSEDLWPEPHLLADPIPSGDRDFWKEPGSDRVRRPVTQCISERRPG